jgi:phosphoserine phosphatase RsbX
MLERTRVLEWSVAGRPVAGEPRSGDEALVLADDRGALVAAVDGIGHGQAAAQAAEIAILALRHGPRDDAVALAERCHDALRHTRGAAIGLAVFRGDRTVTWLGVGNITARLVRGGEPAPAAGHWLVSQSGVVGEDLPPLRCTTLAVHRGDVLVLATDGIDGAFADELVATGPCEEIAARVLRDHARAADDALVVVVRHLREDRA